MPVFQPARQVWHCGAGGASQIEAVAVACPQEDFAPQKVLFSLTKRCSQARGAVAPEGHSY